MQYTPGAGMKKPLNMLEQPIYPDIKQSPPIFKDAGKYWTVDVGQTLLDTETNTQLRENAILAQSRDFGRDQYGHSSYQEKIAVFRPPLQNFYEDHGPLNRLPTKIYAIQPRMNPGTTSDGQGTSGYKVNNSTITDIDKHISDRISTNTWRPTFFAPLEMPQDNSVLPDLTTTLPMYSTTAGCNPQYTIDAPRDVIMSDVEKPNVSASSGYTTNYQTPYYDQSSTTIELVEPMHTSASAGYSTYTRNGDNSLERLELDYHNPQTAAHSGYTPLQTIDGEVRRDYDLRDSLPSTPISAGYHSPYLLDGESHLDEIQLRSQIDSPMVVINPGSEIGYQTRLDSYTTPEEHLKLRQNPKVSMAAHQQYDYRDRNADKQNFHIRTKLQPLKSYNTPIGSGGTGSRPTYGVQAPQMTLKYDSLRNRSKNQ